MVGLQHVPIHFQYAHRHPCVRVIGEERESTSLVPFLLLAGWWSKHQKVHGDTFKLRQVLYLPHPTHIHTARLNSNKAILNSHPVSREDLKCESNWDHTAWQLGCWGGKGWGLKMKYTPQPSPSTCTKLRGCKEGPMFDPTKCSSLILSYPAALGLLFYYSGCNLLTSVTPAAS